MASSSVIFTGSTVSAFPGMTPYISVDFDYEYNSNNTTTVRVTNIGIRQSGTTYNFGSCVFVGRVTINSTTAVYMDNSAHVQTVTLGANTSWHYPGTIYSNQSSGAGTKNITVSGTSFSIGISGCGSFNGIGGYYQSKIIGYNGSTSTTFSYTPPVWTISYNANGGSSTPSSESVIKGNSIALANAISRNASSMPGYTATFDGNGGTVPVVEVTSTTNSTYTFEKWHLNSTSGAAYNAGVSYTPTTDVVFYAGWNVSSTMTNITLPTVIQCIRPGFALLGWDTSQTATTPTYVPGESISLSGDTVFYAIWTDTAQISININSIWELGKPYIFHGGVWQPYKPYIYVNGEWRLCNGN